MLGLANGAEEHALSEKDLTVFKTIAEQSAFAPYNEAIDNDRRLRRSGSITIWRSRVRSNAIPLLPAAPRTLNWLRESAASDIPAKQVSGDYYDYIEIDYRSPWRGDCGCLGQGRSRSLIMAMCRSVICSQVRANLGCGVAPGERAVYPDIKEDMFSHQ